MEEKVKTSVAVVGAGCTGMMAAKILIEKGIDVVILEADSRVGGRLLTHKGSSGDYCDLGGQFMGPFDEKVFELCEELQIDIFHLSPIEHSLAYYSKGRTTAYKSTFPIWNPFIKMDLNNFFRTLKLLSSQVPCNAPWDAKLSKQWDSVTAKQWLDQICWTRTAKCIAAALIRVTFCVEPEEISLLYIMWFYKKHTILFYDFMVCIPTTEEVDGAMCIGGAQQICEKMMSKVDAKVMLNCPVQHISQDENRVILKTENGDVYEADYVICTAPVPMRQCILYSPPLPAIHNQAVQRIPMGSVIKTVTYYKTAFWETKGFHGSCIVIDDTEPVNFILNDTKPDGSYPALLSYIPGGKAISWNQKSSEERKAALCKLYSKIFKSEDALQPINYLEFAWIGTPFIGGGHSPFYPPGVITGYARHIDPIYGRVHFATADNINGALAVGQMTAEKIIMQYGLEIEKPMKESVDESLVEPALSWAVKYTPSVPCFMRCVGGATILASIAGLVLFKYS